MEAPEKTIDDLPEEILLDIILRCTDGSKVLYEKDQSALILMQVCSKWENIILNNFRYTLVKFFTRPRSLIEYQSIFIRPKKLDRIEIKVIPHDKVQYNVVKRFLKQCPTPEVRLDFGDHNVDKEVDPHVFFSYLRLMQNVEKLTLCFSYGATFTIKFATVICNFEKLKHLMVVRGRNLEFFHAISAPNLTNLIASFYYIPKSMKDFMNLANRCEKLEYLRYLNNFEWFDSHLELQLIRDAREEIEKFLINKIPRLISISLFAETSAEFNNLVYKTGRNLLSLTSNSDFLRSIKKGAAPMTNLQHLFICDLFWTSGNIFKIKKLFPDLKRITALETMYISEGNQELLKELFNFNTVF